MKTKIIYVISFVVYLLVLSYAIIFKCNMIDDNLRFGVRCINLIPFYSIIKGFSVNSFLIEIILNIIVFIPFGILLLINTKAINFKKAVIITLSLSLSYEIFQYIVGFGSCDITDVIMNVFGGIIGYIIYNRYKDKVGKKTINKILLSLTVVGIIILVYGTITTINNFNEYMSFIK